MLDLIVASEAVLRSLGQNLQCFFKRYLFPQNVDDVEGIWALLRLLILNNKFEIDSAKNANNTIAPRFMIHSVKLLACKSLGIHSDFITGRKTCPRPSRVDIPRATCSVELLHPHRTAICCAGSRSGRCLILLGVGLTISRAGLILMTSLPRATKHPPNSEARGVVSKVEQTLREVENYRLMERQDQGFY